jgi:hypothetical protein
LDQPAAERAARAQTKRYYGLAAADGLRLGNALGHEHGQRIVVSEPRVQDTDYAISSVSAILEAA